MYFQRDYVLRMIEMVGELMRRLVDEVEEISAREELDEIAAKGCGLTMAVLRGATPESLLSMLDEPQRYLAAKLLEISVEIDRRTHTDDALLPEQAQALALYSALEDPDYQQSAAERAHFLLRDTLSGLPIETMRSAGALFERAGRFADAEDALYAAMESDPAMATGLRAFYHRALAAEDGALRAGGLTREEVREALDELG